MTPFLSFSLSSRAAPRDAWRRRRRKDVCRQQACAETCKDPGLAGFGGGRRGLGGAKGWAAQRRAEGVERGEKSVLTPQDDGGDCATAGD
jgi:hypothetical protein